MQTEIHVTVLLNEDVYPKNVEGSLLVQQILEKNTYPKLGGIS